MTRNLIVFINECVGSRSGRGLQGDLYKSDECPQIPEQSQGNGPYQ